MCSCVPAKRHAAAFCTNWRRDMEDPLTLTYSPLQESSRLVTKAWITVSNYCLERRGFIWAKCLSWRKLDFIVSLIWLSRLKGLHGVWYSVKLSEVINVCTVLLLQLLISRLFLSQGTVVLLKSRVWWQSIDMHYKSISFFIIFFTERYCHCVICWSENVAFISSYQLSFGHHIPLLLLFYKC